MKMRFSFFLSATRILVAALLGALALQVQAAAVVALKGSSAETRQGADAELRMSVLGFNAEASTASFVENYRSWQASQDHEAFVKFIRDQQTRGYVFSKEATGYTIKYAWQDPADAGRMVFVVTPGLKTLNPYLWKTRNDSGVPFTVLETRSEGDSFVLKTSLDAPVAVDADAPLQLQDFAAAAPFATLKDDRPYYLKQGS